MKRSAANTVARHRPARKITPLRHGFPGELCAELGLSCIFTASNVWLLVIVPDLRPSSAVVDSFCCIKSQAGGFAVAQHGRETIPPGKLVVAVTRMTPEQIPAEQCNFHGERACVLIRTSSVGGTVRWTIAQNLDKPREPSIELTT